MDKEFMIEAYKVQMTPRILGGNVGIMVGIKLSLLVCGLDCLSIERSSLTYPPKYEFAREKGDVGGNYSLLSSYILQN
jgi:hypothetical protein